MIELLLLLIAAGAVFVVLSGVADLIDVYRITRPQAPPGVGGEASEPPPTPGVNPTTGGTP